MGTSVSQPSPKNTLGWDAVAAAYTNESVPIERLVKELWRAAQSEQTANWQDLLAAPIISTCLDIAVQSETPPQASRQVAREIARLKASSLASDIAQRAAIQCFTTADRSQGYTQALFVGVSDYLVSRDVSGFIGANTRLQNAVSLIEFKNAIRNRVTEIVQQVESPSSPARSSEWSEFVATTIARLAS